MGECAYNVMDQNKFGFYAFKLCLIPGKFKEKYKGKKIENKSRRKEKSEIK